MKGDREVAILGVGMHPWGMFPEKDDSELGVYAILEALKDADLSWRDIQFMGAGVDFWRAGLGMHSGNEIAFRLGETGIPIINVCNACATSVFSMKIVCDQIRSGVCDIGIAVGAGKSPGGFFPMIPTVTPEPKFPVDYVDLSWRVGTAGPAFWAMYMMRRMKEYGDTEEMLAKVKVEESKGGAVNPYARFRKVFTIEEVLNSPMVYYPLRLYEICATSQGAAAVILGSMDIAKKRTIKPIKVAAAATGSPLFGDSTLRVFTVSVDAREKAPYFSEAHVAARRAFEEAGIGPEDIDFLELPDNSSWHVLNYLEVDGFCKPGEAGHLLMEGYFDVVGGKLPIGVSGGKASFGEVTTAQGLQQVCDATKQLRGHAPLQVDGAKAAFCQTYGGWGNNAVAILKR
jgi:acetyl-CoA acetyltransferase